MGELRKNKDESFTAKTSEPLPVGFALAIHYLEGMRRGNECFSHPGDNHLNVFVKKLNKIFTDFENLETEIETFMTNDQKRKYKKIRVSYAIKNL